MKKQILTICLISFLAVSPVLAANNNQVIDKLENSLYGFTYNTESESSRLDRLEKSVYGTVSTKSAAERVARLKKDMATDLIGQQIEPKEDTFAEDEFTLEKEPVAAANVTYPAVDELEEIVFNKSTPKEDIKKRLSKLEMETFGKEYANDDLATRTDRLKAEIKPKSLMENQIAQSSNEFYDDYVPPLGADYHLNKYQTYDGFDYENFNARQRAMEEKFETANSTSGSYTGKQYNLSTVEKKILNQTFKNDSTENRLSRLESAMFGTNFSTDDNETRMNRISSAYKAQKTAAKYDSNRFSQNLTTAVQIGTLLLMVLACIL